MALTFTSLAEPGYPAFGLDDPAGEVARALAERGLTAAPVLDGASYVGMVTLSGLLSGRKGWPPAKMTLRSVGIETVPGVAIDAELIENLKALMATGSDVIALLDDEMQYAGAVRLRSVFEALATAFHGEEGVASLEIQVPPPGVRLSEMIAAIEKNDASVLSFSMHQSAKASTAQILFFRVVTRDFFRLVRNLEKYGYLVSYHSPFPDNGYDEMREKALEFIRYIDM